MYCPQCGVEYREGFSLCSDCRVTLVAEPPEAVESERPVDDPGDELVTVWETFDPAALAFAKSVLDDAEIPYFVAGENFTRIAQYSNGFLGHNVAFGGFRFQVRRRDAVDAAELLEQVSEMRFFDPEPELSDPA